ncbi:hypothetical protein A4X09_0g5986, partial [Tilletia walkeri]
MKFSATFATLLAVLVASAAAAPHPDL